MLEFKILSKRICLTFFVIGHLYVYTIIVAQLCIKMSSFKLNLDLFNYLCITQRPGFLSDVIKVDEQYILIKVNCCFFFYDLLGVACTSHSRILHSFFTILHSRKAWSFALISVLHIMYIHSRMRKIGLLV